MSRAAALLFLEKHVGRLDAVNLAIAPALAFLALFFFASSAHGQPVIPTTAFMRLMLIKADAAAARAYLGAASETNVTALGTAVSDLGTATTNQLAGKQAASAQLSILAAMSTDGLVARAGLNFETRLGTTDRLVRWRGDPAVGDSVIRDDGSNIGIPSSLSLGDLSQAGATTLTAFGDSITAGNGASTAANRYANLVAVGKAYTLTNAAVSGSQLADTGIIDPIYSMPGTYDLNYSLLAGVNDMRVRGTDTTKLQTFEDSLGAAIAWLAIPANRRTVGSLATTNVGTWTATTRYGLTTGKKSSTAGDTITFSARGSVVYVAATRLTTGGGTFTVAVDGTVYGGTNSCAAGDTTANGRVYAPILVRVANLPDIVHSVVITLVSSAEVQIDWCGGNSGSSLRTGPNVYLGNCVRLNATGYASGAPYNQGSDAAVFAINRRILSVCKRLAADGLNVAYVDASALYDTSADISVDGIHPNDAGHAHIASAFLREMNFISYPNGRQGSLWQRGYTPSFALGEAPNTFAFDAATGGIGLAGGLNIGGQTPPAAGYLTMQNRADIGGGIQIFGAIASPIGAGSLELEYNNPTAYFTAYNRAGSIWKPIVIRGGDITFQNSGATAMSLSAGVANIPGLTASQIVKTDASKNLVSAAAIAESEVTGLVSDLGLKAPLAGTNTWSAKQTDSLVAHFSAGLQITGALAAPDGVGSMELEWNNPTSYLTSYDRNGAAWKPIVIRGSTVTIQNSGTDAITLTGGAVNIPGTFKIGLDSATAAAVKVNGPGGVGTDKVGGDVTIAAGIATGTGRGGALIGTTSLSTTTGSSAQTESVRYYYSAKFKDLVESSATTIANVAFGSSKFIAPQFWVTVHADNGTDFEAFSSRVAFCAVNKAGVVTVGVITQTDTAIASSSGTLTCTYTAVANGASVDLKANAVSSLTQTTLRAKWALTALNSDDAGTVTPQ